MNATKSEWLGIGLKKRLVRIADNSDCGIGFFVDYQTTVNVDLKLIKYLPILGIGAWMQYGFDQGWIQETGCPKHELKNANIILTVEQSDIVHLERFEEKLKIGDHLVITNRQLNNNYVGYMSTSKGLSIEILEKLKSLDNCDSFIDIGCGPASVLSYAKDYYKNIYGIDIEQEFVRKSKEIVTQAHVEHIKAEDYLLPNKKMHIYLFNPFNNFILNQFLSKNITNIKNNDSLIAYYNSFSSDHLIKLYGMSCIYKTHSFSIYKFIPE